MATDLSGQEAKHRTLSFALVYLCLLEKCYKLLYKTDTFKGWSVTYTLLGILRAPEHFDDFYWIRSLYEGADMGEGIIKTLRPLCPTGIREGWALNMINNYYKKKVMSHLITSCHPEESDTCSVLEDSIDETSFVRYGSKCSIRNNIQKQSVLSVLFFVDNITKTNVIGSMILQIQTWFFCVINVLEIDNCVQDEFGYSYFQIELTEIEHEIKNRKKKIFRTET